MTTTTEKRRRREKFLRELTHALVIILAVAVLVAGGVWFSWELTQIKPTSCEARDEAILLCPRGSYALASGKYPATLNVSREVLKHEMQVEITGYWVDCAPVR